MDDKNMQKLKEDYLNTPIPKSLGFIVDKTLNERRVKMKKQRNIRNLLITLTSTAAVFTLITVGVNTSPAIADSLGDIPIIKNIVKVLSFKEYKVDEDNYSGDIVVPEIEGLENKNLQDVLNEKYVKENKELYNKFIDEIDQLKASGGGHLGVDSGYVVKTDTDEIFSIARYTSTTAASSDMEMKYDTISKKDNVLVTLPSLFKDDRYVMNISKYIKEQMIEHNQKDKEKVYWIKEIEGSEDLLEYFKEISPNQSFYINKDGKLVISFDKYEVAPGYMGVVEFIIPTEIISDVLTRNEYIK